MPVNRDQWQEKFGELPHWPCTLCGNGALVSMPGKLIIEETGLSIEAKSHDAWEPDWTRARFAGFMQCSSKSCGDVVAISGNSPVSVWEYQDWEQHVQNVTQMYVVKSVFPAPVPIKLPDAVPENIKTAITSASALVWASSEAAGNALRQVVELFLTDVGVSEKSAKGGYIPTHIRIEEFQKTDAENGDALLAVKWLGNSSSHPGGLTRDDVLDAFDMIEFVFENRYGVAKANLKAKIAAIIAAKGPAKPTPKDMA